MVHDTSADTTVVFTADDFGVTEAANRAIASAHAEGVLTSAGIMVCEDAAGHAAKLAADLPRLGIGLHLTLSDGHAALSHAEAPQLVLPNGRFRCSPFMAGLAYWFARSVRAALRREIVSQFERCARLGLRLDHADGHQHLHVHPIIWDMLAAECASRGVHWIRLPVERPSRPSPRAGPGMARRMELEWEGRRPRRPQPRAGPGMARRMEQAVFRALAPRCRRVAQGFGLQVADHVVGHLHTGDMTEERMLEALAAARSGITEIYSHPGASDAEHRALIGHRVREAIARLGIRTASFGEIPARHSEGRSHGANG